MLPAEAAAAKKRADYLEAERGLRRDPEFLRAFRNEWVNKILIGQLAAHKIREETPEEYLAGFPDITPQLNEYEELFPTPFIYDPLIPIGAVVEHIGGAIEHISVADITNVTKVDDRRYSGWSQDGSRHMGISTNAAMEAFVSGLEVGTPMVEVAQLYLRYPDMWKPLTKYFSRGYFAAGSRWHSGVPSFGVFGDRARVHAYSLDLAHPSWRVLSRGSKLNFGS